MYIAVCDDQMTELDMLKELLDRWQSERQTSLRFKTFRSAADLLDATAKEKFNLYLLDVMMPGMDGIEAFHKMREDTLGPNIDTPVVIHVYMI